MRSELRATEDEAIREAIRRQIACGLDVITDGEFRRWMFMNSFYDAVSGVRTGKTVAFRNADGEEVELRIHEIVDRLRPVDAPGGARGGVHEGRVGRIPVQGDVPRGVDLHAPADHGRRPGRERLRLARGVRRPTPSRSSEGWWPTRSAAGATSIQFDFPLYPYLVDPAWVARFTARGTPDRGPRGCGDRSRHRGAS